MFRPTMKCYAQQPFTKHGDGGGQFQKNIEICEDKLSFIALNPMALRWGIEGGVGVNLDFFAWKLMKCPNLQ